MPSASIDTFFACALVVSVALLATGFFAGTMQTRLSSSQDANEIDYLGALAEHIVTSCGSPADWGSTESLIPQTFGLGKIGASVPYEVDVDKISRLNSQNEYSLSYFDVSKSARLNNIAFSVSASPLFSIDTELTGNETAGDATAYTFKVSVSETSGQTMSLHCYAVAKDSVTSVSGEISSNGVGYVNAEIPNASSGPALLIVFARASFDDRMTSYAVYPFAHLSDEPTPNNSFLGLSPLNYVLNVNLKFPNSTIEDGYFFSYSHQSNLTSISENTFAIPAIVDKSPFVMALCGSNGTADFAEWVSYPQLPNHFGADFTESEENVFTYTVTIKETLYKLTLSFGDVPK